MVVDGANCGYYKQNYAGAPSHVDYRQIDWMLRQLQSRGLRPLLVLHSRHTAASALPTEFAPIVAAWRAEALVYETPPKWNDDWFWLYTAVALGCRVVTNDEMRDHHFQMLSPRFFQRWKERRQIRFAFGAWVHEADLRAQQQQQGQAQPNSEAAASASSAASASATATAAAPVPASASVSAPAPHKLPLSEYRRIDAPALLRQALLSIPRCYSHRSQCLEPGLAFAFPCEGRGDEWLVVVEVGWARARARAQAQAKAGAGAGAADAVAGVGAGSGEDREGGAKPLKRQRT